MRVLWDWWPHSSLVISLRPSDAFIRQWTNHHWFRQWLVAWSASSHYLNQCWDIVNWTLRDKLQWSRNRNSYISIQGNAFENVICKMAAILSRPRCVMLQTALLLVIILPPTQGPFVQDVMTWMYFQHYWPCVWGIHCLLVEWKHKGPVVQNLDWFLNDNFPSFCWAGKIYINHANIAYKLRYPTVSC